MTYEISMGDQRTSMSFYHDRPIEVPDYVTAAEHHGKNRCLDRFVLQWLMQDFSERLSTIVIIFGFIKKLFVVIIGEILCASWVRQSFRYRDISGSLITLDMMFPF